MNFKTTYLTLLLFFSLAFSAQVNSGNFLENFAAAGNTNKLRLAANLPVNHLKQVYPEIKDTIEKLKYIAFFEKPNIEAKFLLDVIDANLELSNKNYPMTIYIAENCLQMHARNINDSLICYSILKNAFVKARNYFKAYEVNTRMELMWPRKSDTVQIAFGIKKSSLYASLGFMKEAVAERRAEFASKDAARDTESVYNFYSDLGIYFNRLKLSDSASVYFLKALDLLEHKKYTDAQKVHYEFLKGVTKGNLGLSYFNSNLPEKAIPLIKEDIYYSRKSQNFESLFLGHKVMAECYMKIGKFSIAQCHIDSAEKVLKEYFRDGILAQHLYFVQSKYFEGKSDYKKANEYLNKYFAFRDSLARIEKEQNLMNTEIAFKIEQKDNELKEKTKVLKQKELEEARQKTFNAYSLAGIILLLVVIIFLILINYFSKKREKEMYAKNEQIKAQKTQIEQSLKEKEVLIKEIHHRVKNNLQIITSMLSLQISKETDKESEDTLREAKQRISSIALTHQMLYQNPNISDIPVNQYIENLVRQIASSIPHSNINLITELEPNDRKVNIDNAIPLGLVINELLTNAFKHAFNEAEKGTIKVTLRETDEDCLISVSDNGKGLPKDFSLTNTKSLGMELIHILAEQLDAKLNIINGKGSTFTLEIPKSRLYI